MKSFYMPQAVIAALSLLSEKYDTGAILRFIEDYCFSGFDKSIVSDTALERRDDITKAFVTLAVPLIDEANFVHRED